MGGGYLDNKHLNSTKFLYQLRKFNNLLFLYIVPRGISLFSNAFAFHVT